MPGFSRSDQAYLALLVRAQRGALNKIPYFSSEVREPNAHRVAYLVWLLRQAVILCRSRTEPRLTGATVDVSSKQYQLQFPEGWLASRPLTQKALEEEAACWQGLGMTYRFK